MGARSGARVRRASHAIWSGGNCGGRFQGSGIRSRPDQPTPNPWRLPSPASVFRVARIFLRRGNCGSVETTMIYTHVLNKGVTRPVDSAGVTGGARLPIGDGLRRSAKEHGSPDFPESGATRYHEPSCARRVASWAARNTQRKAQGEP